MTHAEVQNIAKQTMAYIKSIIKVGMPLKELKRLAEEKMLALGATSFWYWGVGAFIFSNDETTLSVSGRVYQVSDRVIERNDIITVDLSPQVENVWGDYARTIILENGAVVNNIEDVQNTEWKSGLMMEEKLHHELCTIATPEMTFEQLHRHMNGVIAANGFINLDFLGNLGHSIEEHKDKRIYIESGNSRKLGSVDHFTFEPHIAQKGSKYGYKKESIYHFQNNKLTVL